MITERRGFGPKPLAPLSPEDAAVREDAPRSENAPHTAGAPLRAAGSAEVKIAHDDAAVLKPALVQGVTGDMEQAPGVLSEDGANELVSAYARPEGPNRPPAPADEQKRDSSEEEAADDLLHYIPTPAAERPREALDLGLDEPYLVIRDYCIRGGAKASCDRCARACPTGAISFGADDYPVIDESLCSHCGICAGVCDGFSSTRVTIQDLYGRMMRIAASSDTIYLTCDENLFEGLDLADEVVVLPCLAMIPPQLYALLLAEGLEIIIACDLDYCDDCQRAPGFGEPLYTAAIQTAERWTGRKLGFTDAIPEKKSLSERLGVGGTDRRSLFTGLASEFGEVASGNYRIRHSEVLQEFHAMQERMRASVRGSIDHDNPLNRFTPMNKRFKKLFPRQGFLYSACKLMPEMAERVTVKLSVTDPALCDQQLDCLAHCPTAARAADDFGNLLYDARYCIGCGTCVARCPRGACSLITAAVDQIPDPVTIGDRQEDPARAARSATPQEALLLDADDLPASADDAPHD